MDNQNEYIRELKAANEDLRRENAQIRIAGKALRNALAFECKLLGDVPREIDEWDALVSSLPNQR